MKLEDWRKEIDSIDSQVLGLINRRAEVVKNIGMLKANAGLPIIDADRESDILLRLINENEGMLEDERIVRIFRGILQVSREIQIEAIAEIAGREEVC